MRAEVANVNRTPEWPIAATKDSAGERPPAADPIGAWHTISVGAVLARLDSAESGLSSEEAARRLHEHGPNELESAGRISPGASSSRSSRTSSSGSSSSRSSFPR